MPEASPKVAYKHRGPQLAGLVLWRCGLLLAAGTGIYRVMKVIVQFVDLPLQLEIGAALVLTGLVFVVASFVMERIVDYRAEGDLSQ